MKEILGKKIGMTLVFEDTGEAVSVTVIKAGPCPIICKKTTQKEGNVTYQVGFEPVSKKQVNKPKAGQFAKAEVEPTRYIKEIRNDDSKLEVGSEIKVNIFNKGERVDVTGVSRGLGFAGVMKRHGFSGANKTHGQSDRQRAPGSIGQSSYPSRVFKGIRMPGRMGKDKTTVLNLEIVKIIENENLMLVKGSVPGFKGSILKIRSTNRG